MILESLTFTLVWETNCLFCTLRCLYSSRRHTSPLVSPRSRAIRIREAMKRVKYPLAVVIFVHLRHPGKPWYFFDASSTCHLSIHGKYYLLSPFRVQTKLMLIWPCALSAIHVWRQKDCWGQLNDRWACVIRSCGEGNGFIFYIELEGMLSHFPIIPSVISWWVLRQTLKAITSLYN